MMNKEKFLGYLIFGLVILNIVLLSILCMRPKPGQLENRPQLQFEREKLAERLLVQRLNLDKDQVQLFRKFKEKHKRENKQLDSILRASYQAYYALLKADSLNIEAKNEIGQQIEKYQAQLNEQNIQHFAQMKGMLREDQKDLFNEFIDEMSMQFIPAKSKLPPPNRKK